MLSIRKSEAEYLQNRCEVLVVNRTHKSRGKRYQIVESDRDLLELYVYREAFGIKFNEVKNRITNYLKEIIISTEYKDKDIHDIPVEVLNERVKIWLDNMKNEVREEVIK